MGNISSYTRSSGLHQSPDCPTKCHARSPGGLCRYCQHASASSHPQPYVPLRRASNRGSACSSTVLAGSRKKKHSMGIDRRVITTLFIRGITSHRHHVTRTVAAIIKSNSVTSPYPSIYHTFQGLLGNLASSQPQPLFPSSPL